MLVSEIISRIRSDLSDSRTVEYSTVNLLNRIRTELNDTAGSGSSINVLNEVRKILADETSRTGTAVTLAGIRAELNDTADITAVTAANLLSYLREIIGDDATRTGTTVNLASLRAELNDTADISPISFDSSLIDIVIPSVRAKLGDPADSVLGTTTADSVSVESVIHYAQWSTTGDVSGTDSSINSSVELASGSGSLSDYAADGIKTIKGMRPDTLINGNLPGGFQNALNLYVLARCLEGEVETEVGSAGYRTFYDRFEKEVAAVPPHITDSVMTDFLTLGITEITARRPDLGNSICKATLSLLEDFVMAHAAQSKLGTAAQPNLTAFYSILDSIPYHYSDTELNQYIADGQNAIKALRHDAASIINCFSEAVKSYAVCHATGRRFGKVAETMSLWQAHDANFKAVIAAVPYHWTDAELNAIIAIVSTDLTGHRPDLGICTAVLSPLLNFAAAHAKQQIPGNTINLANEQLAFYTELEKIPYHYLDSELNQYIAEGNAAVKALRPDADPIINCFSEAVKSYAVCHATGRRFGKVAETMSLWQAHDANFKAVVAAIPYHWTDAELNAFITAGGNVVLSKRPDLNNTSAKAVCEINYTVFNALERRIGIDTNAAAVHQTHHDQFYADLENLPHHWTDAELTNFQNEAMQTVTALRDDLTDNGKIRSDMVEALIFCISSLANNSRKDAASRNLSDTQWTKLNAMIKSIPYHWTDAELLNQLHDSIRDIIRLRSDARMDDSGFEQTSIETEPLISDQYPLRESFAKASEWFSAAAAISCRIGSDTGADAKYQLWQTRYQNEIRGAR